jgi:hypothetical protein
MELHRYRVTVCRRQTSRRRCLFRCSINCEGSTRISDMLAPNWGSSMENLQMEPAFSAACTESALPGWACRTRTQKCRDKISLERSHRFAGIQPNSGFGDCSRLSCAAGEMPRREVGIGGTVRQGSFRDGTPTRLDRETCRWLHARGDRARAPGGTSPLCRDDQSRFTAHRDLGYGRDCCQRRPEGARSVLASTGAQWTSRGRTLREYVASDGNGLQNLIAIISELRRSAGAACGRPVQTYCPIGPLHRSCLASEGVRTST